MSELENAYEVFTILNSQTECRTCRRCEEEVGLVYLLGPEDRAVEKARLPVFRTSQGVGYLGRRHGGWCSAYDEDKNICKIYQNRPLCCRIYPLDLMVLDEEKWWVLHLDCPITQRFKRERRLGALMAATVKLESTLSDALIKQWLEQDRSSQRIEGFSQVEEPVLRLRRFGEKSSFLG